MNLKKIISCCLALVLAIQLLPVKQVGLLLCSNQIQEEIPHTIDSSKQETAKEDVNKTVLFYEAAYHENLNLLHNHSTYYSFASKLPSFHAKDIHTPPPNRV